MYQEWIDQTQKEFPDFKIIKKSESPFMKLINTLLLIVTFGQMKLFMTNFYTTIGTTVYVPDSWDESSVEEKLITLRHEKIHMQQSKRLGQIWFSLLYLFLWFPTKYAYFRTQFEQEAYEESMKAIMDYYGADSLRNLKPDFYIKVFTGPDYVWMWHSEKDIIEWFEKTKKKILGE